MVFYLILKNQWKLWLGLLILIRCITSNAEFDRIVRLWFNFAWIKITHLTCNTIWIVRSPDTLRRCTYPRNPIDIWYRLVLEVPFLLHVPWNQRTSECMDSPRRSTDAIPRFHHRTVGRCTPNTAPLGNPIRRDMARTGTKIWL